MPHRFEARRLLGRRLQSAREACDLTREELAARLGEDADVIKRWELGRTRIPAERLLEITLAVKTSVADLLRPGQEPVKQAA